MFVRRMFGHAVLALSLLVASLGLGVTGYHFTEELPWLDALLNASTILGGMGQVNELHTAGGKLFASGYSLFSGMAFLVVAGILVAPVAHRLLHRLHLEAGQE
jgi:hypothetical protein